MAKRGSLRFSQHVIWKSSRPIESVIMSDNRGNIIYIACNMMFTDYILLPFCSSLECHTLEKIIAIVIYGCISKASWTLSLSYKVKPPNKPCSRVWNMNDVDNYHTIKMDNYHAFMTSLNRLWLMEHCWRNGPLLTPGSIPHWVKPLWVKPIVKYSDIWCM